MGSHFKRRRNEGMAQELADVRAAGEAVGTQQAKNKAALRLLREWMADESGCDEETWPLLKKAIKEDRLSERKRFGD